MRDVEKRKKEEGRKELQRKREREKERKKKETEKKDDTFFSRLPTRNVRNCIGFWLWP